MYDEAYLKEYQKRSSSEIGQRINQHRWDLVQQFCSGGKLLDYGCGAGAFHQMSPQQFEATGFDINPHAGFDQMPESVDILTMWDVIEHLPMPTIPIESYLPEWLFVSTPNIENACCIEAIRGWKHYKPGEHLWYFSLKGLSAMLMAIGYDIVYRDFVEGAMRDPKNPEAILTLVARKL